MMKLLPPILVWLTLLASSFGEITIEVPTGPIVAGQHIQVYVHGIETEALSKAVAKHWPRTGTTFVPAKTWGDLPFIYFSAPAGEYLIWVAVDNEYTEAVVVVGGPQPDPFPRPFPDPDPQPVPPGQLSVVILCETQTRGGAEAEALFLIRAYASQAQLAISIVDQDLISGSTNKAPPWLEPWAKALNQSRVQVPAILVGNTAPDGVFSIVAVEPLTTGEAAIELVKSFGGKP